jgi:hypothetical protein
MCGGFVLLWLRGLRRSFAAFGAPSPLPFRAFFRRPARICKASARSLARGLFSRAVLLRPIIGSKGTPILHMDFPYSTTVSIDGFIHCVTQCTSLTEFPYCVRYMAFTRHVKTLGADVQIVHIYFSMISIYLCTPTLFPLTHAGNVLHLTKVLLVSCNPVRSADVRTQSLSIASRTLEAPLHRHAPGTFLR